MTTLKEIEARLNDSVQQAPNNQHFSEKDGRLLIRAVRQLDKLAQFHAFHEMKEWLDPDVLALLEEGR